ncbi:MAG: hypothetical protein V4515_08780 [Chloroflexota bacterium]
MQVPDAFRIAYVTTPDGPILLLLSLDGEGSAETRFVFGSILGSLTLRGVPTAP